MMHTKMLLQPRPLASIAPDDGAAKVGRAEMVLQRGGSTPSTQCKALAVKERPNKPQKRPGTKRMARSSWGGVGVGGSEGVGVGSPSRPIATNTLWKLSRR